MNDLQQIVPGVLANHYDLDARFTRGTLEGLAAGVRDAVWKHFELFESTDAVTVYVGGNRRNSLDSSLEVSTANASRADRVIVPVNLMRALNRVRTKNLPAPENALWECNCAEYCDQSHGEGRLELRILKPTFHEMSAFAA